MLGRVRVRNSGLLIRIRRTRRRLLRVLSAPWRLLSWPHGSVA
ncbi:hypothetical protein DUI70_6484 [Streptomyces albus]|nr:hypothetical protein DUI70_6484 [Streptomyces albus]